MMSCGTFERPITSMWDHRENVTVVSVRYKHRNHGNGYTVDDRQKPCLSMFPHFNPFWAATRLGVSKIIVF